MAYFGSIFFGNMGGWGWSKLSSFGRTKTPGRKLDNNSNIRNLLGVVETVVLENRVSFFVPYQKQVVLTKSAKILILHSTHKNKGFCSSLSPEIDENGGRHPGKMTVCQKHRFDNPDLRWSLEWRDPSGPLNRCDKEHFEFLHPHVMWRLQSFTIVVLGSTLARAAKSPTIVEDLRKKNPYGFHWGGLFYLQLGLFYSRLVFVTYGGLFCLRLKFGLVSFTYGWISVSSFLLTVENRFGLFYLRFPLSRKLGLVFFTYGSPTVSKKDEP